MTKGVSKNFMKKVEEEYGQVDSAEEDGDRRGSLGEFPPAFKLIADDI